MSAGLIKKHKIKSCCGSEASIFETERPIRKYQVDIFRTSGFNVPPNFLKHGIFYVTNGKLVATGPYGSNRINVKCSGNECGKLLFEFENLLKKAIQMKNE